MKPNSNIFITITAIFVFAVLGVVALYQYANIISCRRLIKEELASLNSINAQLAKIGKEEEREWMRLLNAQHSLYIVEPTLDDKAPRWQRVRELLRDGSDKNGKRLAEFRKSFQAQRPKPPKPNNAYYGNVFLELLNDPEYAALAKEVWVGEGRQKLFRFMRATDLADSDKLVAVQRMMTDERIGELDIRAAAVSLGLNEISDKVVKKLRQDFSDQQEAAMKALVGEEAYNRYARSVYIGEGFGSGGRRLSTDHLVARLSYSPEPLSESQIKQMRDLINAEAVTAMGNAFENVQKRAEMDAVQRKLLMSDEFTAHAAEILTASQLQGLRDLQDEKRAYYEYYVDRVKAPAPKK